MNMESLSEGSQDQKMSNDLEDRFLEKIPLVESWIDEELKKHEKSARPVSKLGFKNLGLFFTDNFLDKAKVVQVEKVTQPPIATEFGIEELKDFEDMHIAGITYKDTYFIDDENAESEPLHFHELVHVVQWSYLGASKFLEEYGKSLLEDGYADSVFEKMARKHVNKFVAYLDKKERAKPYDVIQAVQDELDALFLSTD